MSAIQCIDSRTRTKATKRRTDVVFIRKSSPGQDEAGQKANVENMLRELGVYVPAANWFSGTVSRRNVKVNAEFNRLMDLVEADLVGTVYIESQDRWGTKDRPELFSLLGILREHHPRSRDSGPLRAEATQDPGRRRGAADPEGAQASLCEQPRPAHRHRGLEPEGCGP